MIMQHCEVTMVNAQFARQVAHLESREGCPITPGSSLTKVFHLNPSARNNKDKRGMALDGNARVCNCICHIFSIINYYYYTTQHLRESSRLNVYLELDMYEFMCIKGNLRNQNSQGKTSFKEKS